MQSHVESQTPQEACGLLAGVGGHVFKVYPVSNILHSPTRYTLSPTDQLQAFLDIQERNWSLIGIYHSHPSGPSKPSKTDIKEAYYPEAVHLIWSRKQNEWRSAAYSISGTEVNKVPLYID